MPTQPTRAPSAGPSTNSPRRLRPKFVPLATLVVTPACPLGMSNIEIITIGSSTTSFIPVSRRSAIRGASVSAFDRSTVRRRTGSVEARAAPTIAAAGPDKPSRSHALRAVIVAGTSVPGPSSRQSMRRRGRSCFVSSVTASLKRSSASPSIASEWSAGEWNPTSAMPNPHGPMAAPRRRKIATNGKPLRSITPESRDAMTMTMPISATDVTKLSNFRSYRRWSVLDKHIVRITVQPALTGLPRRDHRMTGCTRVFRGVLVRRIVAAPRPAALLASSQMHPG